MEGQIHPEGLTNGQYNLGQMYYDGVGGVAQNYVVAYALYNLAASNWSYSKAINNRDVMSKQMSVQAIEAGQLLTKKMHSMGVMEAIDAYLR